MKVRRHSLDGYIRRWRCVIACSYSPRWTDNNLVPDVSRCTLNLSFLFAHRQMWQQPDWWASFSLACDSLGNRTESRNWRHSNICILNQKSEFYTTVVMLTILQLYILALPCEIAISNWKSRRLAKLIALPYSIQPAFPGFCVRGMTKALRCIDPFGPKVSKKDSSIIYWSIIGST